MVLQARIDKYNRENEGFYPRASRSSWFVVGAQKVMFRAKQNEPSAGGWDTPF